MKNVKHINYLLLLVTLLFSCGKDEIEYANGYPSVMAGNWVVFEFAEGDFDSWGYEDYTLVTALDPNRDTTLIISNLYNSNIRVRVPFTDQEFDEKYVVQFDTIDGFDYNIHYITLDGEISQSSYLKQLSYQYALATFPDMDFDYNDIEDVIVINAGFYDIDTFLVDSAVIFGYRKTGFEDVPLD